MAAFILGKLATKRALLRRPPQSANGLMNLARSDERDKVKVAKRMKNKLQRLSVTITMALTIAVVAASPAYAAAHPARSVNHPTATPHAPVRAQGRQVNIVITDHGFQPNHVLALLNQTITLRVVNSGSKVHQFSIPYYYIYSQDLKPGAKTTISFAPWTAGRFDMMSDPTGKDTPEFNGKFTVTDQK